MSPHVTDTLDLNDLDLLTPDTVSLLKAPDGNVASDCGQAALEPPQPAPVHELPALDLLPPDPPGLPAMRQLELPGPRREREGRGGATALATTLRLLIRCPLVHALGGIFPPQRTGRPTPPAAYWLFYSAFAREVRSFEAADQEIKSHYALVRAEFAAQGVTLPTEKPGTTNPVPGYAAYNRWRATAVISAERLSHMQDTLRVLSLPLARAIREAEGRTSRDPLNPSLGEVAAGDASVFQPPSGVRQEMILDEATGKEHRHFQGSRAHVGDPRVHDAGGKYGRVKKHGPTEGIYYLALSAKGYDTYTRVVLDVHIADPGQGESDAVVPRIHRLLSDADGYFQAIAYDGQIYPKHSLEVMQRFGVYTINHNAVGKKKGSGASPDEAGATVRDHGQYRDRVTHTYYSALPSQQHTTADGQLCVHHLVSDDGAVYETDRPLTRGRRPKKLRHLPPTALARTAHEGGWHVDLTITIPCPHGQLTFTSRLTDSKLKGGSLPWSEPAAALRVIPERWTERFRAVYGARNQIESLFSWLEQRFYTKDRAASWGYEAQLVDLIGAALMANAEAWAHYVYRHAPHPTQQKK